MTLPPITRNILMLRFQIDTNRINIRKKLPAMNQLEKWKQDGVLTIDMSEPAFDEAMRSPPQASKAIKQLRTLDVEKVSDEEAVFGIITRILFPNHPRKDSDRNDINVVFHAWKYKYILITDDGDSKSQPGGILGNAAELEKQIGVKVLRDTEAVKLVQDQIKKRDDLAIKYAEFTGNPLPDWVGKD